jgi:outer membrane protein TolC
VLEVNVTRLAQDLINQRALLDVYRGSRRAAQGWLTAVWDTYEAGFSHFRDVMDALVQFYEKRIGYLQVVYQHNLAAFRLSQALGVDVTRWPAAPPPEPGE